MKLQSLTVIFVIIVVPLSLILSVYIQTQIDTIVLQSSYDTKLINSTYDSIKSFQLNTVNNNYSSVSDSKIRDVEAAINTFFNSLSTNLGLSGYKQNTIKPYVPALVYTLYDGYYIYSPYKNTETNQYIYGLKPYIYYTCRYIRGTTDVVVNYTLDNYIIIYGTVNGRYITKAGYLIDPGLTNSQGTVYNGVGIGLETLSENILVSGENTAHKYTYVYRDGEKIYKNPTDGTWFKYVTTNYTKVAVNSPLTSLDASAISYYKEAYEFTTWVNANLGNIQAGDAVNATQVVNSSNNLSRGRNTTIFSINRNNNPDNENSDFNEHRRAVIKNSIQTNLNSALENYNKNSQAFGTTYNFKMPIITEVEWDKVLNNICAISFFQGLPIGYKVYNNYCIMANTINKEFVSKESIEYYDININQVHTAGCTKNIDTNYSNLVGYSNTSFAKQTVKINGITRYYYPHSCTKCYFCVVDSNLEFGLEDVMTKGRVTSNTLLGYAREIDLTSYKKAFYHAYAREKYNLYKINSYLNKYYL